MLSKGHASCMKAIFGDNNELQPEYDDLTAREQLSCTWLPKTTRDLALYNFKRLVSSEI